jgi:hypothetical protein
MTSSGERASADAEQEAVRLEEFLQRFFGEGNDASRYPEIVEPFVQSLRRGDDAPAVLPRFVRERDQFALYVIAPDTAAVMPAGELIEAFAGATYCTKGDTAPAELDPSDPVDAAVIRFAGANRTFVVQAGPGPGPRARLRVALTLMQKTVAGRPARLWRVTRPLGRLLAEFEASLSAGGEAASQTILDQLAAQGGITATNLACLRIKRLDRLGRSEDLLSMDGLAHVLLQDPPAPVKEAVLNAIYSTTLEDPLQRGDIAAACNALRDSSRPLPLPVHDDITQYGDEAAATLITAAIGRGDAPVLERMASALVDASRMSALPQPLQEEIAGLSRPSGLPASPGAAGPSPEQTDSEPAVTEPAASLDAGSPPGQPPVTKAPESWPALCRAIARDTRPAREALRDETWRDWPSPAESDSEFSQVLDTLDDSSWASAWQITGPFIQAVGYDAPAPLAARALIIYALAFDRLGPGDLIAIQALTEICLRASPSAAVYSDLLDELRGTCQQWVSPENAVIALDFADRLVLAACPDDTARTNFAIALLDPLNSRQGRLEESDVAFARQLSAELAIPLDWQAPAEQTDDDGQPLASLPMTVLLYSLDEAVLDRTSAELQRLSPRLKIATSHDKTATSSLKKKSHNADVIVLATRCAKHAATGFITENKRAAAVITYADGSGSASLLRAATDGLGQAAGS